MRNALRLAILLISFAPMSLWREAQAQDAEMVVALRGFFVAVAAENYAPAWAALTAKSQDFFVQTVADGEHMSVAATRKLFDDNDDRLQRGFWAEFRKSSNVEKATQLPMTPVGASGADGVVEVNANGKKVTFKMYKEGGRWKVGWMETFFPTGTPPAKK